MKETQRTNSILFTFLLLTTGGSSIAQTPTATSTGSSIDATWWLIIGVAAILLVAILMLGNVLLRLAQIMMDKSKSSKGAALVLMLLCSSFVNAQEATTSSSGIFGDWNLVMAATVITTEIFVIIVMLWRIQLMLNELSGRKKERRTFEIHLPKFVDAINAAVPIEREKDVLLDHNYDGIRELDNDLPPWWKYGFYATIIFAVVYLSYYHVAGGPSSEDEYTSEMLQAKADVDAYMKKNALTVDENSVTLADASGLANGMEIFKTNCATCHGNSAEGNAVGPNLTDGYWIHGGSLADVFKSVKYGWPAKGMKSWQTDLTPIQIKDVASFIKSLQGSNPPNAKAPQGDLYTEGSASAVADTTAVAAKPQ